MLQNDRGLRAIQEGLRLTCCCISCAFAASTLFAYSSSWLMYSACLLHVSSRWATYSRLVSVFVFYPETFCHYEQLPAIRHWLTFVMDGPCWLSMISVCISELAAPQWGIGVFLKGALRQHRITVSRIDSSSQDYSPRYWCSTNNVSKIELSYDSFSRVAWSLPYNRLILPRSKRFVLLSL